MRKALRWLRRILLSVLALAVIAIVTVVIALHTDWGREKVRARLASALAGQFPGARVGKLEGSVFGELVVRDVELDDAFGHPAVTVGTLRVELALWPLLRKTVRVDRLIVDDVAVLGRPYSPPSTTSEPPPPKQPKAQRPPSPNAWSIELPDVQLHRAMVRWPTKQGPVELDGLELGASASLPAGAPIAANLSVRGTWKLRNAPFSVTGDVLIDNENVGIPVFSASLGGVSVTGSDVLVEALSGRVVVTAPAAAVTALVPEVVLPGDVRAEVDTRPVGNQMLLAIDGTMGPAAIHGSILGDVEEQHGIGFLVVRAPELAALTQGALVGSGGVFAALDGSLDAVHGVIAGDGQPAGGPRGSAVVVVSASGDVGHALVLGNAEGGVTAALIGQLSRKGDAITLKRGALHVHAPDLATATAGIAPIAGALRGDVQVGATISGQLRPVLALDVEGRASGDGASYTTVRAQTLAARFEARIKGTRPLGKVHLELAGVTNAGASYGKATIDAANHADHTIAAAIHAEPRDQVAIDVDGLVTPGVTTRIDLGGHQVRAPHDQQWAGTGGRIAIEPARITIHGLHSTSGTSSVEVDANLGRASGDLDAQLAIAHLAVGSFDPRLTGVVDGKLAVDRRRGRWSGTGQFDATAVAFDHRPPITGQLHLDLAGRRATAAGHLSNPEVGSVELTLDVDGPSNPIDVDAWRRVDRRDVRIASVVLHAIALAQLDPRASGVVDGNVVLTGADVHGLLTVKSVDTPAGEIVADITLAPAGGGQIATVAEATLTDVGTVDLGGLLALPDRLFDPVAWKTLGRGAIRAMTAQLDDLAFDDKVLAHLKIKAPYRGKIAASVAIGPGAESSQVSVDLESVEGGALLQPIDLHAEAKLDERGAVADAALRSAKVVLAQVHGEAPLTFDRVLAVGGSLTALRDTPLVGTLTLPSAKLADVVALFGRTDIASGTVDGAATFGGTLGTPTGKGLFAARDIAVTSRVSNRPTPKLDELRLAASWGGAAGTAELTGKESNGGLLRATASGRAELVSMLGSLDVSKFDLAPLSAFLPGVAGAAAGTLDASLSVRGFDLPTSQIRGQLRVENGRLPLSPKIGTLRRATVDVSIADRELTAKIDGSLGSGTIHVEGTGDLDKLDATATLRQVSIINALSPTFDADVTAHLKHGTTWTGDLKIRNGSVTVPAQAGEALLAISTPSDLIFIDGSNLKPPPPVFGAEPPWLVLNVDLGSTNLDLHLLGDDLAVRGSVISPNLVVSVGGGAVGLRGVIESESASADLFGHRYQIDPARLTFDDSLDPALQITMVHDFPDVELIVDITGPSSDPKIEFSSEPGTYAQSQLLGFFLGGEPGGDPNNATREAATGAGASVASAYATRFLNKALPVRLSYKCDVATTSTSSSCAVGKWLSQKIYAVVNQHFGALPTENNSELQIEYYMLKSLLLEGTVGDRQYDGLDLLWRHRW